ncbi:unnamed protein product [Coregonus sp. 'balchen']|nr:unnamed protein product [Coregonus sp. 'balchen']
MSSHHPTDPVELRRINFQTPGGYRISAFRGYKRLSSSDYINANYIDGYRRQNAYIATQGSLPETFCDFWRLVWEQHTANIIMMTKLEEKSRVKLITYGPPQERDSSDHLNLSLSGSEKREIRQFQFTAWPDHGVPEHPTPFLAFLRRCECECECECEWVAGCRWRVGRVARVDRVAGGKGGVARGGQGGQGGRVDQGWQGGQGGMVAGCAGVGRTGCFIVIDAMVERIKHEKTVDIYGHVTLMRSQRNYMVQTEDQYAFIHDALLEAVACGNTEVPARNLYAYIQTLTKIEPAENVTGMELEFKRLASAKAHTSRFVSANLPCNKFKNRLVNIMPYETTRVCLQPIRGVEGSDYINGSFIDGYR